MASLISIDIGTTNLKMVLMDEEMKAQDTFTYRYQNTYITNQAYELDMEEIIQATLSGLASFKLSKQTDIMLTTAMHSLVVLDLDLTPLTPVYAWNDSRAADYVTNDYYKQTGTPPHSMNPLFKLKKYILENKSHSSQINIGSIKDVLYYRLTKKWWIDIANASASGMYDLKEETWSKAILQELGLDQTQFPQIHPSDACAPIIQEGYPSSSMVYLGTSDGVSSNYVFKSLKNAAVLSIGTSHAIRVLSEKPFVNDATYNFCYQIKDKEYLIGYPSNNGGNVFEWINENYGSDFQELEAVARLKDLSDLMIFLPYINGERAPIWNDQATGELLGIQRTVTRPLALMSLVCGTLFNIRYNMENLLMLTPFERVAVVGGLSQSRPLMQLLADVLGMPLILTQIDYSETYGTFALVKNQEIEFDYQVIDVDPVRARELDKHFKSFKKAVDRIYL